MKRATGWRTSIMTRSAPGPLRRIRRPPSKSGMWLTFAPRCMAIWPAVVMWPSRVPTINRRIASLPVSRVEVQPLRRRQDGVEQRLQLPRMFLTGDRTRRYRVDLLDLPLVGGVAVDLRRHRRQHHVGENRRSEEHTSELQTLMRISYAVFCF